MRISRRGFLAGSAGAAAATLCRAATARALDCALVHSAACCRLAESAGGYRAALVELGLGFAQGAPGEVPPAKLIIVPAFAGPGVGLRSRLRTWLERGSTVLFESADGFSCMADFRKDREWMRCDFALELEEPVNLWAGGHSRTPYISYSWPIEIRVRDFSRVVPVRAGPGQAIGEIEGLAVGVRCEVGKGSLVFLGSPLGPGLWAGEREARRWFRALCREANERAGRGRSE